MFELGSAVEGLIEFVVIILFLFAAIGLLVMAGSAIGRRPPPDDRPRDGGRRPGGRPSEEP